MIARLVDCSDCDVIYGILEVKGMSIIEVQKKIYDIKFQFEREGFDEWSIEDVFAEFPKDWDWTFEVDDILFI